MRYILDTNILVHYLRGSELSKLIDERYNPLDSTINESIISAVSVGELKSLSKINKWGETRMKQIGTLCEDLIITDINAEDLLEAYAEIDAFSQGKHKEKRLHSSARNMGKNDLWIAATAHVLDATLLTTDQDFSHLEGVFVNVKYIAL